VNDRHTKASVVLVNVVLVLLLLAGMGTAKARTTGKLPWHATQASVMWGSLDDGPSSPAEGADPQVEFLLGC